MNTSYFNHTGYGPLPFWDDLANYTTFNNRDYVRPLQPEDESSISPSSLGLATGALFILTCGSKKAPFKPQWIIWTIVMLSVLIILLPIICTLVIYKLLASLCLQGRTLKGLDAVWALDADEDASLAIINILAIVSGDIELQQLRQIVREKLVPTHPKLKKLRKSSFFGYFFWKGQEYFKLDDYVKPLNCDYEEVATEEDLQKMVSKVSNAPLPYNHLAGWEILLGPKMTYGDKIQRAIVFRVHHSLGDGPALFKTLLTTLASSEDEHLFTPDPDVIKRLIARAKARHSKKFFDNVVDVGSSLKEQLFLSADENILHRQQQLTGEKQLVWRSSVQMMTAAKSIRAATGASFSAGLLASFLAAVSKFGQYSDTLKTCTVAFPARVLGTDSSKATDLSNAFSFTLVKNQLPGEGQNALSQVEAADCALKHATKAAVLMSNGFICKLVGDLLPRPLAAMALYSGQVTAGFSNMPGPEQKITIVGCPLEKLVFWVPHRGTTGVGASILSYAGELCLGLNVDHAMVNEPEDVQKLVALWEEQLIQMAAELA